MPTNTFATPAPITATVTVAGAQVRVTASDRTDTVVLVEPINRASRSDVRVAERTKVSFAGGQLTVKTTVSGDKNGSVAITIALPAGSSLVAYLAHSTVQAHGALGECELHLASGHVQIGHASADVELSSSSGDFDIDRADGNVTATTASGAIRIGRLVRGHAQLTTASGNIEVGIGEGTPASVDLDSERGSVRNSLLSQQDADPAGPEVTVRARTRHGDIIVRPVHEARVTSTS